MESKKKNSLKPGSAVASEPKIRGLNLSTYKTALQAGEFERNIRSSLQMPKFFHGVPTPRVTRSGSSNRSFQCLDQARSRPRRTSSRTSLCSSGNGWMSSQFEQWLSEGVLNIPHLGLTAIPDSTFHMDPPISVLYLHDNRLEESLPPDFFDRLEFLSWVDLRSNKLKYLPGLSRAHAHLRVILVQNNDLRRVPYSLGLAVQLKSIGLNKNPIIDPPESVRAQGMGALIDYLRVQFRLELACGAKTDGAHLEQLFPTAMRREQELKLKGVEGKSKILQSLSKKIVTPFAVPMDKKFGLIDSDLDHAPATVSASATTDLKKLNKMKYSWELWKDVPYNGINRKQLLQNSVKEAKEDILKKFNTSRDEIIQRIKNAQVLGRWRDETKVLKQSKPRTGTDYAGLATPFRTTNDDDYAETAELHDSRGIALNPEEFDQEFSNCYHKLNDLISNPAPITDSSQALDRVKQVEAIQRKLHSLKLSVKRPHPTY